MNNLPGGNRPINRIDLDINQNFRSTQYNAGKKYGSNYVGDIRFSGPSFYLEIEDPSKDQPGNNSLVYIGWFGNNSQSSDPSTSPGQSNQPLKYWWNWDGGLRGNDWDDGSDTITINGTAYKFTMYSNSSETSENQIYMTITDTSGSAAEISIE